MTTLNTSTSFTITATDAPHLTDAERTDLGAAMTSVAAGLATVAVAIIYRKVTKAAPRIAGTDYQAIPFAPNDAHLGVMVKAARNKAGEPYFLVSDQARGDGTAPTGWTCFKPAGLRAFQVRGILPPVPRAVEPPAV
jgi:hypothetical protein